MKMHDNIKSLLSLNTQIKVSHKRKINEHYGELSLYKLNDELGNEYIVTHPYIKFSNVDEAISFFCYHAYTSKNVGYVQQRLFDKKLLNEDVHNLEKPNAKVKALFEAESILVDQEAIELGIKEPKAFPTEAEATKELNSIMKSDDLAVISEELKKFNAKYSMLDIYIHISAFYDAETRGHKHDYSIGIALNELSQKRVDELKTEQGNHSTSLKYKYIHFHVKIKKDYKSFTKAKQSVLEGHKTITQSNS